MIALKCIYQEMRKILSMFKLYAMRHCTVLIELMVFIPTEIDILSKKKSMHAYSLGLRLISARSEYLQRATRSIDKSENQ